MERSCDSFLQYTQNFKNRRCCVYKLETDFSRKYNTDKLPAGMNNLFQETSRAHTKCTRRLLRTKTITSFRFTEQIAHKTQFNIRVLNYGTALIQKSEIQNKILISIIR